jgi:antitoxin component YwqK of YwqJK toxin-antitoxin module
MIIETQFMKNVKFILSTVFNFILLQNMYAKNNTIVKYYDSLWLSTSKDSSIYFTRFVKKDAVYNCYSYWSKSKKLNSISFHTDTLFSKPVGLQLRYYETGQLQDSSLFYENGSVKNTHHYYQRGGLWEHYNVNKSGKPETSEGFDEFGSAIPNFIFEREAAFPEGAAAWKSHIEQNLKTQVPVKNRAPKGTYDVIVQFIVDKTGDISILKTETAMGYGMEEEVIRVIKKSPKWIPAIMLGKLVNAYRRQPVTFIVS